MTIPAAELLRNKINNNMATLPTNNRTRFILNIYECELICRRVYISEQKYKLISENGILNGDQFDLNFPFCLINVC